MNEATVLPLVWGALIAFAVVAYVILDGFDLGCGILFLSEHDNTDRNTIVNSIAPIWDGNETWLVLGGGGLFAVFPVAYAVVLSALYPVIIAMLLALIFRGVAFEFRFRAVTRSGRQWWDRAFCLGSLVAAFAQGLALGGLLQGISRSGEVYSGGWFDWLTPFTVLCGVAVVVGYALLGACWLIWKTTGLLHLRARAHAKTLAIVMLAFIVVVSLWTPFLNPDFRHRWFGWPGIALTLPVPLLVVLVGWIFWGALKRDRQVVPLLCGWAWFVLCFAGLGISLYPNIVPATHSTPALSLWEASAPPASQLFLLVGAAFLIPIILAYTGYAYWIFRGKVDPNAHYH